MIHLKLDLDKVSAAYVEKHGHTNAVKMAEAFGTTKNTLYQWKQGNGLRTLEIIKEMMDKTGLTFNELFNLKSTSK